jgi:hypothetical protein
MARISQIKSLFVAALLLCSTSSYAGNAGVASGEASEDMLDAVVHLASASGNLSSAGVQLSGDVAITIGESVADVILNAAEVSGDAVVFSSAVLADGLMTTAQLSSELTLAGVSFSADTAVFVANAGHAGIHISADTAGIFLTQAVNITAASGRLSGEAAELAVALAAAGVEFSADSTILIANAGVAGIHISEEAAERFIAASLDIASECIDSAIITERYLIMTLEEANNMVREASVATVRKSLEIGNTAYTFTAETAGHLRSLGIDAVKYAGELTDRAANAAVTTVVHSVKGTNDAIVVVINTGSGLIVASLDSITAAVEATTNTINN